MEKKRLKKLWIIIPVLLLAGCGRADYVSLGLGLDQESIPNTIYGIIANINFFIDRMFAQFVSYFRGIATFEGIKDAVSQSSSYFDNISQFVAWFQALALAYIAIRFGWMILNEYIIQQDNHMATPLMQQFKKLFVALLMVFLLPYITFSAYAGSSYLGITAAEEFAVGGEDAFEAYQVFDKMESLGISYATYCKVSVNGKEAKVPKSNASGEVNVMVSSLSDDDLLAKNVAAHAKGTKYEANYEEVYQDIWNNTCAQGGGVYRVGQGLAANEGYRVVMSSGNGNVVTFLLRTVIQLVFWIVGGYMVAKRTFDIVFLTLMGWYYCGESISGSTNNQAFATFGRKLLSICMTQFFVITEIGIFSHYMNFGRDFVLFDFIIMIAWITFLLGTPTFISEICHDTGASGDAMTGAKAIGERWKAFRGK